MNWFKFIVINFIIKTLRGGTPSREYSFRSRSLQLHRTPDEILDMLEAEVSDTDSDYSDNGSDNNDLEVDIDDIAPYRQLLESIQNQEGESESDEDLPEPHFLKNMGQKGYRYENENRSQDSENSGESSSCPRTPSTPTSCPDSNSTPTGKKRKRKYPIMILTHITFLALEAELKKANKKVSPREIVVAFLDEEGLSVSNRVEKAAENAIMAHRKLLRKVQVSKGKLKEVPGDHVIYDFSGSFKPSPCVTPRGPRKSFEELTRQGKQHRIQQGLQVINAAIEAAVIKASQDLDVPKETLEQRLSEQNSTTCKANEGPSAIEALAHMVHLKATKRTATGISKFTKQYDLYVPGEKALRTEKRKRLPSYHVDRFITVGDEKLPVGVFYHRKDVVFFTLRQLVEMKKLSVVGDTRIVLQMRFNQGMDGAGAHQKIFDSQSVKLSKAGHGLKSCQTFAATLLTCSTAKEATVEGNPDAYPDENLYKCEDPNSYKNLKVLALVMEKESASLQKFLMEKYPDGKVLYNFKLNGADITVYCDFVTCLLDGKTRKAMLGRGGGYCYYCSITSEEYHTPSGVRVQDSFIEYNTADKVKEYQKFLTSEGKIDVSEASGKRKGWTQVPYGVPHGVVVTHAALNIGKWIVQLAAKSNLYAANPTINEKTWEMRDDLKLLFKEEEKKILKGLKYGEKRLIMKDVGLGNTGGGCTGNHAKKFLLYAKDVLPNLMYDPLEAKKLGKISELLYVVIRVLNTSKQINIAVYQHICHSIGILVINGFEWARMNETMHSILAHSWEVIKNNKSHGLRDISEEGMEALQKHVRSVRNSRSWLGSYLKNLGQALETLELMGDLFLNLIIKKCSRAVPRKGKKKKAKIPIIPDDVKSSSELGGLNFLKRVIIGITDKEVEEDTDDAGEI